MKIAYAGFDLMYPAMEALARENEIIRLFTCRVDGVYETNDRVIALSQRLGVPYTVAPVTQEDVDALLRDGCGLLISAGYYHRIPVDSRLPMVNIHPSLLPYGRGAWPMPLAILDGLAESGVTVHKTEESFDTGPILLQESFSIARDEDLESLMAKVNALLPDMMHRLTADFDRLYRTAAPQGEGVYQDEPDPMDYILTPRDTVTRADRVLRAFYGFPCYYRRDGTLHQLLRAKALKCESIDEAYPLVDGCICIK